MGWILAEQKEPTATSQFRILEFSPTSRRGSLAPCFVQARVFPDRCSQWVRYRHFPEVACLLFVYCTFLTTLVPQAQTIGYCTKCTLGSCMLDNSKYRNWFPRLTEGIRASFDVVGFMISWKMILLLATKQIDSVQIKVPIYMLLPEIRLSIFEWPLKLLHGLGSVERRPSFATHRHWSAHKNWDSEPATEPLAHTKNKKKYPRPWRRRRLCPCPLRRRMTATIAEWWKVILAPNKMPLQHLKCRIWYPNSPRRNHFHFEHPRRKRVTSWFGRWFIYLLFVLVIEW